MQVYDTIAAVDLGSNSFRLQVARVVEDQIYPLDSLKETVRLAAGLTSGKFLDDESNYVLLPASSVLGSAYVAFPTMR